MNIKFEKFSETYIDEAVGLALCELEAERKHCPDLPDDNFTEKLTDLLHWLSSQPFGKVAICDGRLVGYLLFGGPWDGFFGNVKGVYSMLGGSAFSYEYKNRGRLASMLFEQVAEDFVKSGAYSCAICRYAHDTDTARSFVFNGFGIRCSDAIREISKLNVPINLEAVTFRELAADEFRAVEKLQGGLNKHLRNAPVFFPPKGDNFESWFASWIRKETMRIFVAKVDNEVIGFISINDTAENFITEYSGMKNICGAFFEEEYRGNGLAQALLAYVYDTLKAEGVTHLGVDCETLNPTALHFWGKHFTSYTYSFTRRIDERCV